MATSTSKSEKRAETNTTTKVVSAEKAKLMKLKEHLVPSTGLLNEEHIVELRNASVTPSLRVVSEMHHFSGKLHPTLKKYVNKSSEKVVQYSNKADNEKPFMFNYAKDRVKERLKKNPGSKPAFKALLQELLKDIESYKRSKVNKTFDEDDIKKDYIIELDDDDGDDNNNNGDNEDSDDYTDSDKDEDDPKEEIDNNRMVGHRRSRTGGQYSTLITLLRQFVNTNRRHRKMQKIRNLIDNSYGYGEDEDSEMESTEGVLRQFLSMNKRRRMREYRLAEDAGDDEDSSLVRQFIRMNKQPRYPIKEIRLADNAYDSDNDGSFERQVVSEPYNTRPLIGLNPIMAPLNGLQTVSQPYSANQELITDGRRQIGQNLLMVPLNSRQFIREPNQDFLTSDRPYIGQNLLNSRHAVSESYDSNDQYVSSDRSQPKQTLVLAPQSMLQPIYVDDNVNSVTNANADQVNSAIGSNIVKENEFSPLQSRNFQWQSLPPLQLEPATAAATLRRRSPFSGTMVGNTRDFLGNTNQLYVLEQKRRKREKIATTEYNT